MGEFVSVEVDDHRVATVRVDRPKVNALNPQVFTELAEAAARCRDDDGIGAVVIWGGPTVFAAGADIRAMVEQDFRDAYADSGLLQRALRDIDTLPKVVVAAVNGYALGGGCELAMSADLRFAGESARLGQPEILLGVIPGAGGTQRLPRLVGPSRAKEIVFTGRQVDAEEALRIGLVDRVVPDDRVHEEAVELCRRMAAGPFALRLAKRAIDEGLGMDLDSGLRLESTLFSACFATDDQEAGMRSFLEQGPGKATFTGR